MTLSLTELADGCRAYSKHEPRDAMYRIAIRLVNESLDNPAEMADALGVILLTWNQAAYRYGTFDFGKLEKFLRDEKATLDSFRARSIASFEPARDSEAITVVFGKALDALANVKAGRRSPVAVGKALHTIAPDFFPLWDRKIADGVGCLWSTWEQAAGKYLEFMQGVRDTVIRLEAAYADEDVAHGLPAADNLAAALSERSGRPKTILKFLDEYYYAKFTGQWIA